MLLNTNSLTNTNMKSKLYITNKMYITINEKINYKQIIRQNCFAKIKLFWQQFRWQEKDQMRLLVDFLIVIQILTCI